MLPKGCARSRPWSPPRPGRTIQLPGGTQALHRAEAVEVRFAGRLATVHRPSLLGAIITKSCAVDVDDTPANQRIDLALFLTMIEDPFELAPQLTSKDRQRLGKRRELLDPTHDAWRGIDRAADGVAALRVLVGRDTQVTREAGKER